MPQLIGIYGAGGHGREIMSVAREQYARADVRLVFIDDNVAGSVGQINGQDVLAWQAFVEQAGADASVSIAIADAVVREKLTDRCAEAGISLCQIRAANVVVGDKVKIGDGAILQPFVTLTADVRIGRGFHANIYSSVSHDCVIGDFVTFAPGVRCNGNIHIENRAYVGAGAMLRQGTPHTPLVIGAGATIGMGAVVVKDVPPGVTVVGNPARLLEKK